MINLLRIIRGIIPLEKASKIFNLDKIGYTLEDAIQDFHLDEKYKQYEYVFLIYKKGYSIGGISSKYGISDNFDYQLKRKINFTSKGVNSHYIIDILNIKINISVFNLDKYDDYIELFGIKEDLIEFKEKFDIKYDVIYEPFRKS